jgi:hypothetical protein
MTSKCFRRQLRKCVHVGTMVLWLLILLPATAWSEPERSKFAYALDSIDYYRSPAISRKKSPDGSPIPPSNTNKLGSIRVGSLLEILEREGEWLKVRNIEENLQGWLRVGPWLTFSDPRLYFRLKIEERALNGYCIFNVGIDNSGGYVNKIVFDDERLGNLELDLSECSELKFAGDTVTVTLKKEHGKTEKFSARLGSGDCYLVSTVKIKLNQTGKSLNLRRSR